jgi:hypothetical protein
MSSEFTPQEGSCSCYSNTYTVNNKPIGRFICHCTICQEYTGQAYNDVTVLLKSDVSELDIKKTHFQRWKMPPNINRGLCKYYPDIAALPEPTMHLFYNRRVADMDDDLPKSNGFAQSQAMIVKALAQGMFERVASR